MVVERVQDMAAAGGICNAWWQFLGNSKKLAVEMSAGRAVRFCGNSTESLEFPRKRSVVEGECRIWLVSRRYFVLRVCRGDEWCGSGAGRCDDDLEVASCDTSSVVVGCWKKEALPQASARSLVRGAAKGKSCGARSPTPMTCSAMQRAQRGGVGRPRAQRPGSG